MARYIDGDKLLEYYEERHKNLCKKNGETDAYCQGYEDAMYVAEHIDFAADVVPTSMVDETTKQFLSLHDKYQEQQVEIEALRGAANSYKMHYENLAREIFEEIDGITDLFAKGLIGELEMYDKLAELKKKYIQD